MLKRWMCAGMCIVLLFMAGCQRNETVKNEKPDNAGKDGFILGQDDQSDLHNGMFPCLQMEDGYLLGLSNMLEYFDRKTKKTVPFCSRQKRKLL